MNVTVKNTNGGSLGPFNIYYDAVDAGLLLASNVSSASLAQGVNLTVSDAATSIIVVNTRTGCGATQQTLQLPPPVTPIDYKDVTVQARLLSATTDPTTASVYYKIDNSQFTLLGSFSGSSCTPFSPVQVPENSTLYLGIMSGSAPISFEASGSTFLCSNPASTEDNYCGLDTPYILTGIRSDTTVSMYAEVNTGVIVDCGAPPPPPPPPPPIGTTDFNINISTEYGGPIDEVQIIRWIDPQTPQGIWIQNNITAPITRVGNNQLGIQPGDEIEVQITVRPNNFCGIIIQDRQPNPPEQIYRTPNGYRVGRDTYRWRIPANSNTNYQVSIYSGRIP